MSAPDYGKMGFNHYQIKDIRLVMSLTTSAQIQEWLESIDDEDFQYALTLLEVAALGTLDLDTENMTEFPEAMAVIQKVQ